MLRHAPAVKTLVIIAVIICQRVTIARVEKRFRDLPEGWKIEKSFVAMPSQTSAISQSLGTRIRKLTNTYFSIDGRRIQVNVLHCRTAQDAENLHAAVIEAHGGFNIFALQSDNSVVEFICDDVDLIKQMRQVLGFGSVQLDSVTKKFIKQLPVGWEVKESFVASQENVAVVQRRLGGQIRRLSNAIFSFQGQEVRVNIIECTTLDEVNKIYGTILQIKGSPMNCLRLGKSVIEFVSDNVNFAIRAGYELGLKPKPTELKYKVSFEAAPLEACDYMLWNKAFNLFLETTKNPENKQLKSEMSEVLRKFKFGNAITLRACGRKDATPIYTFKPNANEAIAVGEGIMKYCFKNLPLKRGIPAVLIESTISTSEIANIPASRKVSQDLLLPTEFWPIRDPEITFLAKEITSCCKDDENKVRAILEWLRPGKNIKFAGPVQGSRYGVKKTLKQRFGQCWDFSDCFVTLCRASGVPCRQVAGWSLGVGGHIWAEVLLDGKGWQQVDPTGGIGKCGIYHIPYLTSDDGEMCLLYLSIPKIEILSQ